MSQIFKYAVSDELIRKNPCDNVDLEIPSNKKKEREALLSQLPHLDQKKTVYPVVSSRIILT